MGTVFGKRAKASELVEEGSKLFTDEEWEKIESSNELSRDYKQFLLDYAIIYRRARGPKNLILDGAKELADSIRKEEDGENAVRRIEISIEEWRIFNFRTRRGRIKVKIKRRMFLWGEKLRWKPKGLNAVLRICSLISDEEGKRIEKDNNLNYDLKKGMIQEVQKGNVRSKRSMKRVLDRSTFIIEGCRKRDDWTGSAGGLEEIVKEVIIGIRD